MIKVTIIIKETGDYLQTGVTHNGKEIKGQEYMALLKLHDYLKKWGDKIFNKSISINGSTPSARKLVKDRIRKMIL